MTHEPGVTGVTSLDHTADVGLDVRASTLQELFLRAARGTFWLIGSGGPAPGRISGTSRRLVLTASDLPALLRAWLRELVYWHATEGLVLRGATIDVLTPQRLEADVEMGAAAHRPVLEIKGVTLHGLSVEQEGDGWVGRVIFDV